MSIEHFAHRRLGPELQPHKGHQFSNLLLSVPTLEQYCEQHPNPGKAAATADVATQSCLLCQQGWPRYSGKRRTGLVLRVENGCQKYSQSDTASQLDHPNYGTPTLFLGRTDGGVRFGLRGLALRSESRDTFFRKVN